MAFPRKRASGEIDLFCIDEAFVKPAARSPLPIELNDCPVRRRRYHSVQLAIITGFFACGGFLCSLFFVDGGDDFPPPHHWLRKSYGSPVIVSPPASSRARLIPLNVPVKSTHQEKTAAQRRQISHGKVALFQTRTDPPSSGFRPALDLRAKWTNFSENVRERGIPFARNLALDVGRKLRQRYFEPGGKSSAPEETDKDAG
jgi:hypothetical protein